MSDSRALNPLYFDGARGPDDPSWWQQQINNAKRADVNAKYLFEQPPPRPPYRQPTDYLRKGGRQRAVKVVLEVELECRDDLMQFEQLLMGSFNRCDYTVLSLGGYGYDVMIRDVKGRTVAR